MGLTKHKRSGGGGGLLFWQCAVPDPRCVSSRAKTSSDVRAHEMNARNVGMFLFHCLPDKPVVRLSPSPSSRLCSGGGSDLRVQTEKKVDYEVRARNAARRLQPAGTWANTLSAAHDRNFDD